MTNDLIGWICVVSVVLGVVHAQSTDSQCTLSPCSVGSTCAQGVVANACPSRTTATTTDYHQQIAVLDNGIVYMPCGLSDTTTFTDRTEAYNITGRQIVALTGGAATPRRDAWVTSLPNSAGFLLVGGTDHLGSGGGVFYNSIERYNVASDTYTAVTYTLNPARSAGTFGENRIGNLLVFYGGQTGSTTSTRTTEVYDAGTDTWSFANTNLVGSSSFAVASCVTSNGWIWFIGGLKFVSNSPVAVTDVIILDTVTLNPFPLKTLSVASQMVAACVWRSTVFAGGGGDASGVTSATTNLDIFNGTTRVRMGGNTLPRARFGGSCVGFDNLIVFAGGDDPSTGSLTIVDVYDIGASVLNGVWTAGQPLAVGRYGYGTARFPTDPESNRYLVLGTSVQGSATSFPTKDFEVIDTVCYNCTDINECASIPCQNGATCVNGVNSYSCNCAIGYSGTQCQIPIDSQCTTSPCSGTAFCSPNVTSTICPRVSTSVATLQHRSTVALDNGIVYLPCSISGSATGGMEAYNTTSGRVFTPSGTAATPRSNFWTSALPLGVGYLIFGGTDNSAVSLATAEKYTVATGTFSTIFTSATARSFGTFGANAFQTISIFAGGTISGGSVTGAIDLYNSSGNSWSTRTLATPRTAMGIAATSSGQFWMAGGNTNSVASAVIEVYDTVSTTLLSGVPSLSIARQLPAACNSGTSLFFGGGGNFAGSVFYDALDIFDAVTRTFTKTVTMPRQRFLGFCAAHENLVAFASGETTGSALTTAVDVYDIGTGVWTLGKPLPAGKFGNTAVQYPAQGGSLLVVGPANFATTTLNIDAIDMACYTCTPSPCLNGGTFVNGVSCTCVAGYSGSFCQTDTNECASNPCVNGGTCVDHVGSFTCTCVSGYSGIRCQTDVNGCASIPCANGGTCVDKVGSFACTCVAGYSGMYVFYVLSLCVLCSFFLLHFSTGIKVQSRSGTLRSFARSPRCRRDGVRREKERDRMYSGERTQRLSNSIRPNSCKVATRWVGPIVRMREPDCVGTRTRMHNGTRVFVCMPISPRHDAAAVDLDQRHDSDLNLCILSWLCVNPNKPRNERNNHERGRSSNAAKFRSSVARCAGRSATWYLASKAATLLSSGFVTTAAVAHATQQRTPTARM